MLFGSTKCCGCCCLDGHIDRTKRGRKCCDEAGGQWVECPEADICACECTPTATINDVIVGVGDPGFPATFTFLGAEPVTPAQGWTTVEFRFWSYLQAGCIAFSPPSFYVLYAGIVIELVVNGTSVSGAAGFFGYAAGTWEYLFTKRAMFDDNPNTWPCVQSSPVLNIGPAGPDAAAASAYFGGFGFGFWPGLGDEYEDVAAPYFAEPTDVALNCIWTPECE